MAGHQFGPGGRSSLETIPQGNMMNPIKDLVTTEQLATMAGIKPGSIHGLITRGAVPPPDAKVGRTSVWHVDTATQWLERRPGPGKPWAGTLPEGNPDKAAAVLAEWVTVKQVAQRLGVTTRNITDRVDRGTFPAPDGQLGRTLVWHVNRIPD